MKRLLKAGIASITVHVAVLIWAGGTEVDLIAQLFVSSTDGLPEPNPIEFEIVEIPEVDEEPVVRGDSDEAAPPLAWSPRVAMSSTSAEAEPPIGPGNEPTTNPTETSGALRMRGQSKTDQSAPEPSPTLGELTGRAKGDTSGVSPLVGPPKGVLPLEPPREIRHSESELRKRGGIRTTEGGTYVAHTDDDGLVKITDKPNLSARFNLPDKKLLGSLIRSWQADPYKHARGESEVELPSDSIISGRFDVSDALIRAIGDDPYVSKKLSFLNRTRKERAQIALKNRTRKLKLATRTVRKNLDRIAARTDLSEREKRELYFELWDECAESGPEDVIATTRLVRAAIIGYVTRKHPNGEAHGYSPSELRALNRTRTSAAPFAPYPNAR